MISRSLVAAVYVLLFAASAWAQKPGAKDVRGPAEKAAYDKALCVYAGMTEAGAVFTTKTVADQKGPITPETQARAARELDAYSKTSAESVRKCLSEADVVALGRFSFFDDMVLAANSKMCGLTRTPAVRFGRTPNNTEGDIVNAATLWAKIPDAAADLDKHPFFKAQAQARAEAKARGFVPSYMCRTLIDDFGPSGKVMPGLVRPVAG